MAPPAPRRQLMSTRTMSHREEAGGWEQNDLREWRLQPSQTEVEFSLLTFPRRLTHPVPGRSPDSRFYGLVAFPTSQVSGVLANPRRSQWRGRAGFSPASRLSL